MIIHKCDKCGTTQEQKRGQQLQHPTGWFQLCYKKSTYSYGAHACYELCPDCRKALKIPEDKPEETVGDRLIEILCEIVQNETETD